MIKLKNTESAPKWAILLRLNLEKNLHNNTLSVACVKKLSKKIKIAKINILSLIFEQKLQASSARCIQYKTLFLILF